MRRALVIVALLSLSVVPSASAKAPASGKIRPGLGMGGIRIGQFAEVVIRADDSQVVRGRHIRRLGRVHLFCFEGDQCAWKVRGGGFLTLTLNALRSRVVGLGTNARGWSTGAGIHRGSTPGAVQRAYPDAKLVTRCIGPAGAPVTGYRLRSHGNVTLFSLNQAQTRVDRIHVVNRTFGCG